MFGSGSNDPNSQTENIGDNPIKASMYGIKNLKVVAKNLMKWTIEPGENYNDLEEIYGEMIGVYRRYILHVHNIVGGVYDTKHNENQKGVTRYLNVDKNIQLDALDFLYKNLWSTQDWLMDKELVSQIKSEGIITSLQDIQLFALTRYLNSTKLNRLLNSSESLKGNGLSVKELVDSLFKNLIKDKVNPNLSEQRIQLHFVDRINTLMNDDKLNASVKSILLGVKNQIKDLAKKRSRKGPSKNHFLYLKGI